MSDTVAKQTAYTFLTLPALGIGKTTAYTLFLPKALLVAKQASYALLYQAVVGAAGTRRRPLITM